ncbi:MAG: ASKHA domain-containing protein [Dehalococcoidia bacterium]
MAKITILPSGETIDLEPGESVRDALYRAGIELETPCNGKGVCGQCGVWVENPHNVPETPHDKISPEEAARGLRLACRLIPETDLVIEVPPEIVNDTRRILQGTAEEAHWHQEHIEPGAKIFTREGAHWIRKDRQLAPEQLEDWQTGFSPNGLAIDLGTTTVVATLVSLITGDELATASLLNPQIQFGHDVMSRIYKGSTPEGLEELAGVLCKGVNRLIRDLCTDSVTRSQEIVDVVMGGNTTMLQLAARIDPAPLGRIPFKKGLEGGECFPVDRFGLDVNPAAQVYIPPVAHAFVGSDISAGLLACDGFFEGKKPTLFIDAGTNGELALSAGGKCMVTSTAAGPAFEGMGISCGMRVGVGAIEAVFAANESILFGTVGNAPARGICGSGIIDLIACLREFGVVEKTGRMRRPSNAEGIPEKVAACMEEIGGFSAFQLAEGVHFTQEDVREIQLAKGAIRAAIDMFLKETGTSSEEVQRVMLAGGFGYSLEPENLEAIGMIPPGMAKKVSFAGNTSRLGCVRLLLDISERRFIEKQMARVEHIPLAERPEFMELYVENMRFPEQMHDA